MIFWIFTTILSLLAMAFVTYPVFARKAEVSSPLDDAKKLYEARLKEIESDEAIGRLSSNDAEAARIEQGRNLLKAQENISPKKANGSRIAKPLFALTFIFIPIFTLAIYTNLGTLPDKLALTQLSNANKDQASLETLVAAAETRLAKNPDDLDGWLAIAPVYLRMKEFDKSINAFRNAVRLDGDNAENTFSLGEAMMAKGNGQISLEALDLFKKTSDLDPKNPVARYYIGIYDMQQGDLQGAIDKWQAMLDSADGNEDWLGTIQARISELKQQLNGEQTPPKPKQFDDEQLTMIQGMVSNLEARLEENPKDQQGWEMLVRSYNVLERREDALNAIEKARVIFKDDELALKRLNQIKSTIGEISQESNQ